MNETTPRTRRDLEFFPVQHGGQQLVLIRDHLGLVEEGKAVVEEGKEPETPIVEESEKVE